MSSEVVLVTTRSFGTGAEDVVGQLEAAGCAVVRGDATHDADALAEPLGDAVAWIAGTAPIGDDLLAAAPRLRIVARAGTGTDAVDLHAAAARGIVVTSTPGANAESVADHAVGLMLAALRGTVAGDAVVRAGGHRAPLRGRELGALTVGLVGFGAVGRGVAHRVSAGFGARVLAHDPFVMSQGDRGGRVSPHHVSTTSTTRPLDHPGGRGSPQPAWTTSTTPAAPSVELVDLDALLAAADVVSLHLPGGDAPLVDAAFLARMRPSAVLVNTARGSLLDEAAVAAALHDGRLGALAADVLAAEPTTASPLLHAPNVTLTPHAAATTVQAIDRMGAGAVAEVLRVLAGDPPRHPVTP